MEAIELGHETLQKIIGFSDMLPIAEDLGNIPREVFASLKTLGIPGTKVIRWMRSLETDGDFIPLNEYYPLNMTCLSTHDTETTTLWWEELPKEAKAYCKFREWKYEKELSDDMRFKLVKDALHTPTLFHINLLQEYLALVPSLVHKDPIKERINVPGTMSSTNWTYRMLPSVEAIKKNIPLHNILDDLLST